MYAKMANAFVTTRPFSCLDAVKMLCKMSKRKTSPIQKEYGFMMKESLFEKCQSDLQIAQVLLYCQAISAHHGRKQMPSQTRHLLLIDVRHLPEMDHQPCWYGFDMETGSLVMPPQKRARYQV